MSLLNYSTSVKAMKTASEISEILVRAGARRVVSEFDDDGNVVVLSFSVKTPEGVRGFSLPVNTKPVEVLMRSDSNIPKRFKTVDQANNVAWRIIKDWIEAQVALIATEMVALEQVMMPYMISTNGTTLYEAYKQHLSLNPASIEDHAS